MESVTIIETGLANIASVEWAFKRLGAAVTRTTDPDLVRSAERVILPGVGAFGAAAPMLHASGLAESIRERVQADRPTLAICLGFQLLAQSSDESPGTPGIGCVEGRITRIPNGPLVPQLGWNRVSFAEPSPLVDGHASFVATASMLRLAATRTLARRSVAPRVAPRDARSNSIFSNFKKQCAPARPPPATPRPSLTRRPHSRQAR